MIYDHSLHKNKIIIQLSIFNLNMNCIHKRFQLMLGTMGLYQESIPLDLKIGERKRGV